MSNVHPSDQTGEKPSKSSHKWEDIISKVLRNGRKKKCQEMGERALTHVFVALTASGFRDQRDGVRQRF